MLQPCYLSGKTSLTLKVIQLEDIIPRCLATCVLPCHVVWLLYAIWPHSATDLACDPAGTEGSSEIYTQTVRSWFKWYWASSREGLHGKSKPLPTGDAEFHPRTEGLSSSLFHEVTLILCISLSWKCGWGPVLRSCRLHFNLICAIGCHGIFRKVIFENARGDSLIFGIS